MTEITEELIRTKAREIVLSHATDVEFLSIGEMMQDDPHFEGLTDSEFDDVSERIDSAIGQATVTVTWPDEQSGPSVGQLRHIIDEQAHQIQGGLDRIAELEAERDGAYRERAHLVALLAAQYPSHIGHTDASAPDWAVVTVELPTGQACWHVAPGDMDLFKHVAPASQDSPGWDGHSTEKKYERVAKLTYVTAVERREHPMLTVCGHGPDMQCVECVPDDGVSFRFYPLGPTDGGA